jgi:hypothetical protein
MVFTLVPFGVDLGNGTQAVPYENILSPSAPTGNHKIPLDKYEQMCYNIKNEP